MPAPAFWHGVFYLATHNERGHGSFALGRVSQYGFWFYYPLVLVVKTPIPFLLLVALGGALFLRRRGVGWAWWECGALGAIPLILLSLLSSQVNIGSRHVLILYPLTALGVAPLLSRWLARSRRPFAPIAVAGLLLWQAVDVARAYPNLLAYFNPLAGDDPGHVLVVADLDWGQGAYALARFSAEKEGEELYVLVNGSAPICALGVRDPRPFDPDVDMKGWVIVSERIFRPAVARMMEGEDPTFLMRRDACDPTTIRRVEVDRAKLAWFFTEEPVGTIDGVMRIYDRRDGGTTSSAP